MPASQPFAHLHVWSEYSFPDGACRLRDLVRRVAELEQPAVAVTDQGTLYSAVAFYREARLAGVKPIFGLRLELLDVHHTRRDGAIVLLAEDLRGYRNLLALSTAAHLNAPAAAPAGVTLEELRARAAGLVALSGGPEGVLRDALAARDLAAAARRAETFKEIFGRDAFFLELQSQSLPGQREMNAALRELGSRLGLATVVTNEVRYLRPQDAPAQRLLRRIRTGVPPENEGVAETAGRHDLADGVEMARRFPDDEAALRRTLEIARRCTVELPARPPIAFPRFPLPGGFARWDEDADVAATRYLREQAAAGLARRLGWRADADDSAARRARERLDRELEVIARLDCADYFLVVADYARFARASGIAVGPGRGAETGSLVAFALEITDIDPLRFGLSFERFLNPERREPPDFDLEFCPERRGEVIAYLRRRYGEDRVAQIVAFNAFTPRAALRDAARALRVPAENAERWARLLPDDPRATLAEALSARTPLRRLADDEPTANRVLAAAVALEGLPRAVGVHASGVVVSSVPLVERSPLQRDREGALMTQYDMASLPDVGLVKLDLLGLRALGVQRSAAELVAAAGGNAPPDFAALPLDDRPTLDLIARGDTVGVFQLESAAFRDLLRRIGVTSFEDLVIALALHRPTTARLLDEYLARRHGRSPFEIRPRALQPALAGTLGLFLFQEQVPEVAERLARLPPARAERLREELAHGGEVAEGPLTAAFRAACRRRRLSPDDTEEVLEALRRCAAYGANRFQCVALALLAFRAAWLKAHHPREFLCAALSQELGDVERTAALLTEARRLGVAVRRPDLNRSAEHFSLEGGALRFGLAAIKFVGPETARSLVAERRAHGDYRGLLDLCARLGPEALPRRAIESLVRCGALDFTGVSRRRLFDGIPFALERAACRRALRAAGQTLLPGVAGADAETLDDAALPPAEPWPESVRMAAERELLGFTVADHPLVRHEWLFPLLAMEARPPAAGRARLAGLVAGLRATDDALEFQLETLEHSVRVVARGAAAASCRGWLRDNAAVWVEGEACAVPEGLCVEAGRIGALESAAAELAQRVRVRVAPGQETTERLDRLRRALESHPGSIAVALDLLLPSGERVRLDIGRDYRVTLTEAFVRAVEDVLGRGAVSVELSRAGT